MLAKCREMCRETSENDPKLFLTYLKISKFNSDLLLSPYWQGEGMYM